jgi:hypothetical protein
MAAERSGITPVEFVENVEDSSGGGFTPVEIVAFVEVSPTASSAQVVAGLVIKGWMG